LKKLYCCKSKDGEEIDGEEFEITTLEELINILMIHEEIHFKYFEDEDDLHLWIKVI